MVSAKKIVCSIAICVFAMIAIVSCVEPYNPPVTRENVSYLVVDAFLDVNGEVSVKLSRTLPLYSTDPAPLESGAEVHLQSESGEMYLVPEEAPGVYAAIVPVDKVKRYRMLIKTTTGEEILSQYTEVKITPPIDSIYWRPTSDGLNIYLDTHDPGNKSQYYKWDFEETFEYTSAFASNLLFIHGEVLPRPIDQYIFRCWRTDLFPGIMVASSKNRSIDAIRFQKLKFIERGSLKLKAKYSIQVAQHAITEEAYNYWLQLEKTTASLGGLFDPMPAEITGNFYSLNNPDKSVIGFFSAGSVQRERIFIEVAELPDHLRVFEWTGCRMDSIPVEDLAEYGSSTLLISAYGMPEVQGYFTSTNMCIDCRLQGGITTRPDFWQ